jgi:hypothetical protein
LHLAFKVLCCNRLQVRLRGVLVRKCMFFVQKNRTILAAFRRRFSGNRWGCGCVFTLNAPGFQRSASDDCETGRLSESVRLGCELAQHQMWGASVTRHRFSDAFGASRTHPTCYCETGRLSNSISVVPSPLSRATASPYVLVNNFQVFQSYVKTCRAAEEFWWGTVCRACHRLARRRRLCSHSKHARFSMAC